eukprot:m.72587 g.72587  ORF g.72587 m.72587 type:complete len:904 (-) comp8388_c3_seq1:222-2933(-)
MSTIITPKPPTNSGSGRFGRRSRFSSAQPHHKEDSKVIKIVDDKGNDVTPRSLLEPTRRKTVVDVREEAEEIKFSMTSPWNHSQRHDGSVIMQQSSLPQFSVRSRSNSLVSSLRSSFSLMVEDDQGHASVNDSIDEREANSDDDAFEEMDEFAIADDDEIATLSDAELNKMIHVKIEETDTMFFLDIQPTWVDDDHAEEVTKENKKYEELLKRRIEMADSFGERFTQTGIVMQKQKQVQTTSTSSTSVSTQASQASIFDDVPRKRGLFKTKASQLLGKMKIAKSQSVRSGTTRKTVKELGFGVVTTDYEEQETTSIEDQWEAAKESSSVSHLFELMERLLQHEELAEEQCQLWDGVVDPRREMKANKEVGATDAFHNEPSEGLAAKETDEKETEKDEAEVDQAPNKEEEHQDDRKDDSANANNLDNAEGVSTPTPTPVADNATGNNENNNSEIDASNVADDDWKIDSIVESRASTAMQNDSPIQLLLTYKCKLTENACVTCFAWNEQLSYILAVGYSIMGSESISEGLVLCWSVKQPKQPLRVYRTSTSAMSIAFSKDNPMLMAIGCASGQLCMFDTQTGSSQPLLDTTTNDPKAKHSHAIWALKFVAFDSKDGADTNECLISAGIDGVVNRWTFHKGLEPIPLIHVKRVVRETGRKGHSLTKTSFIARQAGVTCFDFSFEDSTSYIIGTEDGNIHRCATAYTDSYLTTCFAHDGVIHRIAYNPFNHSQYLSCSVDWSVKIWDGTSEEPQCTLLSKHSPVEDATWSHSNASVLASVCDDTLFLWDLKTSTQDPVAHYIPIKGVRLKRVLFNTERSHIVVGDCLGNVHIVKVSGIFAENANESDNESGSATNDKNNENESVEIKDPEMNHATNDDGKKGEETLIKKSTSSERLANLPTVTVQSL